jgi:hypothetical protein
MIEFPVSQPCLTGGGSNERFTCQSRETGRRDTARKEDQRELKEKLPQISVSAVFLSRPTYFGP